MLDPRQLVLLSVALLVPTCLIVKRQERLLLAWICFTVGVQIFDTQILVNVPAARLVGLMLIPYALHVLPGVLRTRPGKALVAQYGYLVFLGLLFGFIFPWPAGDFVRTFNQLPAGRALIYLIRTGADLSLAFFVARQVVKSKHPDDVVRYILVGTSVAALGGILEFLTRADLYGLITGLRMGGVPFRMRGFNYEPRGLSLIAALGMLLSWLLYARQRSWRRLALTGVHALSLLLAGSASGLVAIASGGVSLLLFDRPSRSAVPTLLCALVVPGMLTFGLLAATEPYYISTFQYNIRLRLLTTERYLRPPENVIENVAFRLDQYDVPAMLFLANNPFYLFIGAGPGLVSLPDTTYMPPNPFSEFLGVTGINTLPSTGVLLELSNAGLIGLALWVILCTSSLQALRRLSQAYQPNAPAWTIGRSAFAVAAAIYFVQTSPLSAIWPVFMGIGIAAAYLARVIHKQSVVRVQSTLLPVSLLQHPRIANERPREH